MNALRTTSTGKRANAQSKASRRRVRLFARVALCAVIACALAACMGCRDTDALKEIIYDQNAPTIDYDNPNKHYINNSQAEKESNAVSSKEVSDEDPTSDIVQNLIIYSSTPNSEGFIAKMSKYTTGTPDFPGIEASETVFFFKSDRVDAVDHAVTAEEEQEEDEAEDDEQQAQKSDGESNSEDATINTSAGTSQSGGTAPGLPEEDDNGGGKGSAEVIGDYDPTDGFSPNNEIGGTTQPDIGGNAFNPNSDPEDDPATSYAAFGACASLVQMIGGKGALVATDYETLKGFHNAGVSGAGDIANGSVGDIALGWRDSGSAKYMDADAIIEAFKTKDPEGFANGTCHILIAGTAEAYIGNYGEVVDKLNAAGIKWTQLRTFATSTYIKDNASDVARQLVSSNVAQYSGSAATDRATTYAQTHDAAIQAANGGLARTLDYANEDKVLQTETDTALNSYSNNTSVATLLVNAWDAGAYFSGYPFDTGIAFASMGYSSTPVSFYLQAGGAVNRAAVSKTAGTNGEAPVTQMTFGAGIDADTLVTTTVNNTYTRFSGDNASRRSLLDSGTNEGVLAGRGLGTNRMPVIIATSSDIKDAIILSSSSAYSLYHPGTYQSSGIISGSCLQIGGVSYWCAIGNDSRMSAESPENPVGTSIPSSMILVNPNGYFCDWTQGTVESFLESTWLSSQLGNGYSYDQWKQDVVDFYRWAYDVNININTIVNQ